MLVKTGAHKGIISNQDIQLLRNKDWRIINKADVLHLEKAFERGSIFHDSPRFIEDYLDKLYDREFSSILIGGLGLGVAPYMCQSFCDVVDVVEIDPHLIELIDAAGYLSQNVNVIEGDVFIFQPQQKYDVILIDIWQNELGSFYEDVEVVRQKYTHHLNKGGLLYLPLENMCYKSFK